MVQFHSSRVFMKTMKKLRLLAKVSLVIPSGQAKMGSDISPFLGQYGLDVAEFCRSFNLMSQSYFDGVPLKVEVEVFGNRTYRFKILSFDVMFFFSHINDYRGCILVRDIFEVSYIYNEFFNSSISIYSLCRSCFVRLKTAGFIIK